MVSVSRPLLVFYRFSWKSSVTFLPCPATASKILFLIALVCMFVQTKAIKKNKILLAVAGKGKNVTLLFQLKR